MWIIKIGDNYYCGDDVENGEIDDCIKYDNKNDAIGDYDFIVENWDCDNVIVEIVKFVD